MICKNCNSENDKNAKYCSACGSLVDKKLYSTRRKELAKTLIFLISTLVILFVVIFRIQSDFENFISYDTPLNLTTEQTKDKLIGKWISVEDTNIFKSAEFTESNFKLTYTHESKTMAGSYIVDDSNTITFNVLLISDQNIGSPIDMQDKFYFQGEDTLVIVFNGISNIFERY